MIDTVLHLLMVRFDMTEVQTEIDEYFKIVDMIDKEPENNKL